MRLWPTSLGLAENVSLLWLVGGASGWALPLPFITPLLGVLDGLGFALAVTEARSVAERM